MNTCQNILESKSRLLKRNIAVHSIEHHGFYIMAGKNEKAQT